MDYKNSETWGIQELVVLAIVPDKRDSLCSSFKREY